MKVFMLVLVIVVSLVSEGIAGKNEGWVATDDLSVMHRLQRLSLNAINDALADEEHELSKFLAEPMEAGTRNVAFFQMQLVIEDKENQHLSLVPLESKMIFESGGGSVLDPKEYSKFLKKSFLKKHALNKDFLKRLGVFFELIKPMVDKGNSWNYTDEEMKEFLSQITKVSAVGTLLEDLAPRLGAHTALVRDKEYLFNTDPVDVDEIFSWIERVFSSDERSRISGEESHLESDSAELATSSSGDDLACLEARKPESFRDPVDEKRWNDFLKLKQSVEKAHETYEAWNRKSKEQLQNSIDDNNWVELQALCAAKQEEERNFEAAAKKYENKVSGEYSHSEQKILKYIDGQFETILECIREQIGSGNTVVGIFLNLHSRFDICEVCGRSIINMSRQFEARFQEALGLPDFVFKCFASFREERTKHTTFSQEMERSRAGSAASADSSEPSEASLSERGEYTWEELAENPLFLMKQTHGTAGPASE